MSGNARGSRPKVDRRVRRTRQRLGEALWDLLQEKPLDSLTVQEVLDRAGVGRSTFYTHFSDKDDLLITDIEEFLEGVAGMLARRGDTSDRVAPVEELFAHVAEGRHFHEALVASGRLEDFNELALGHFARGIEDRLATMPRGHRLADAERPAVARALAGSLLTLVYWWLDRDMPLTPAEVDRLFHRMVWEGVDGRRSG